MNLALSLDFFLDLKLGYFDFLRKKPVNAFSRFLRDCCNDSLAHSQRNEVSFCCFNTVNCFAKSLYETDFPFSLYACVLILSPQL